MGLHSASYLCLLCGVDVWVGVGALQGAAVAGTVAEGAVDTDGTGLCGLIPGESCKTSMWMAGWLISPSVYIAASLSLELGHDSCVFSGYDGAFVLLAAAPIPGVVFVRPIAYRIPSGSTPYRAFLLQRGHLIRTSVNRSIYAE